MVKEDMWEVGTREDEVFWCGEGGHAGGRTTREDEVYGESAVVTTDGKADRIRRSRI